MKRTPFKRKPPAAYVKAERVTPVYARLTVPVNMPRVGDEVATLPKEELFRSEPYRRAVAALPCINCHIEGYSQAAHPPPTAKGRKECDRLIFPLCCTRPGAGGELVPGCHADFDQYRLVPASDVRALAASWGAQTRKTIRDAGKWPASIPHMEAQNELDLA